MSVKKTLIVIAFIIAFLFGCKKLPDTNNLTGKDLYDRFLINITRIDYIENRKLFLLNSSQRDKLIKILSSVDKIEFIEYVKQDERPIMFNFHKRSYVYRLLVDEKYLYFNRNVLFPASHSELNNPVQRNFWSTRNWIKMNVDRVELSNLIKEIIS